MVAVVSVGARVEVVVVVGMVLSEVEVVVVVVTVASGVLDWAMRKGAVTVVTVVVVVLVVMVVVVVVVEGSMAMSQLVLLSASLKVTAPSSATYALRKASPSQT